MKAVVALLLGAYALAAQAQAQEQAQEPQTPAAAVTEADSFRNESAPGPAQLPDVNELDASDSIMPAFASEPQNQALMLGGLLAMGFMVRRRREG